MRRVARTIERSRTALNNLTNMDDPRYVIADEAWSAKLDRATRVNPAFAQEIAAVYADMTDARHSYDRVATSAGAYLDAIHTCCGAGQINRSTLSTALAAERLTFQTLDLIAGLGTQKGRAHHRTFPGAPRRALAIYCARPGASYHGPS